MQTRLTTRSLFSSQHESDEESEHEPQISALSAFFSNMEKDARAAIRFGDLSSSKQRRVSVDLEPPAPIIDSVFFHNGVQFSVTENDFFSSHSESF